MSIGQISPELWFRCLGATVVFRILGSRRETLARPARTVTKCNRPRGHWERNYQRSPKVTGTNVRSAPWVVNIRE